MDNRCREKERERERERECEVGFGGLMRGVRGFFLQHSIVVVGQPRYIYKYTNIHIYIRTHACLYICIHVGVCI